METRSLWAFSEANLMKNEMIGKVQGNPAEAIRASELKAEITQLHINMMLNIAAVHFMRGLLLRFF